MEDLRTHSLRAWLTRMNLRQRFILFLGGLATLTFIAFFVYAQYATQVTEEEFAQRGHLLAQTLARQNGLALLMQDTNGLQQELEQTLASGYAIAGAFLNQEDSVVAAQNLETLRPEDLAPPSDTTAEARLRWSKTQAGVPVLIAQAPVTLGSDGQQLGRVLVAIPAESVQAQQRTGFWLSMLIAAFITLVVWLILVVVQRTVVRPVDQLRQAARAVEQGDLSVRVAIDQQDEIGQLAASFNAMVEASERNMEALREQQEAAEAARKQAESLRRQAEETSRRLQERFRQISQVIAAVTRGDLTHRLEVPDDDEVGALMRQINQMIEDLTALVREIHATGNALAEVAHNVSTSAEEMSAGASSQAHQTMEVATAIEEMTQTIASSAQNAHEANRMAKRASELAASGEEIFRRTTEGMHRIATIVKDSTQKVMALGESSAQIGEIIQVISSIADQTNLLALNAAIEAARAGEQGRGFAVVADEVRKLAERTTSATKEIEQMITRIQQNTSEVVDSMTKGNAEVEAGLKLADDASHAFGEILQAIDQMVLMINQIASASEQQSATSSQISQSVEEISSVANEVSRATSELAATANVLNQHVLQMRQLIERFRIRQESGASTEVASPIGDGL
ncbi:methyl-accepting chemotaxis protein [Rhodothermus profundi]|uniref:Methyl-accepting chemotaxis protein n=1 Tax=Rhodothermus profundi TaxID=633813 RepID=A0A1M6PU80_9BACT|nr:methyl-accepting chemotaxis protein [Rhodothermus profundi]SHK11534.1 methyl-accepting chemotaxis protein [Rhodothermus profundi]